MFSYRKILPFVLGVCAMMLSLMAACAIETKAAVASDPKSDNAKITINKEMLTNKRFQFFWKSADGGSFNGIALLEEGGVIRGIESPNEVTWLVDDKGALLFKHADGRISTRFDEAWLEEGRLCFKGPFLFRNGITHYLVESANSESYKRNRITSAQREKIKYSSQRIVYLDLGDVYEFQLEDGVLKKIQLTSVKEYQDPVIHLTRRADVRVEINGKTVDLICSPYAMPTEIEGMRIQADTTSAWLDIPKRVQFSLWDARDPIVDADLFCFPLSDYRLFSQGIQAYNEPVHLGHRDGDPVGQRFYHNYGVDLAGYEGEQKVMSCIDGIVIHIDRQNGSLFIKDDNGFVQHFGHLDPILSEITGGTQIKRGQWVGMLGKRGPSGNFSHVHIGALSQSEESIHLDMNRNLNLYPWLVTAYQRESGAKMLAVARPFKSVLTGDRARFDSFGCLAFNTKITSFEWVFHDGVRVKSPKAEKIYDKPGCYIASLWIKDDQGDIDVDFCKVRVYSRDDPEDVIPTLFVTYIPSQDVRVDQPVRFRIWDQGRKVSNICIEIDEEALIQDYAPYSTFTHTFKTPGIHIVTATGRADNLPVMQKVKVVISE